MKNSKGSKRVNIEDVMPHVEKHPGDLNLTKGSQVPIPNTLTYLPKLTEFSLQFNDFNKEWRQKRFQYNLKDDMLPINRQGAWAQGRYMHDKEKLDKLDGILKFRKKMKETEIEQKDIETQEQRDLEGAEIRGFVKLNQKKGEKAVKEMVKKVAKGINEKRGYFSGGMREKEFEKARVKNDDMYKNEIIADEFAGLDFEESKQIQNKELGSKTTGDELGV